MSGEEEKRQMATTATLIFSWDANGLNLCETTDQAKANASRKSPLNYLRRRKPCVAPEFAEEIRFKIAESSPSLVVVTTQNEGNSSYFHSKVLPAVMQGLKYRKLLDEERRIKTSKTQLNELAVEMSIYERLPSTADEGPAYRYSLMKKDILRPKCQFAGQTTMAAVVCTVSHPLAGLQTYVALHVPAHLGGPKPGMSQQDIYASKQMTTKISQRCITRMLMPILDGIGGSVAICGNFNQVMDFGGYGYDEQKQAIRANKDQPRKLQEYDPLTAFRAEYMNGYTEGVDNLGPDFQPTCGLRVGRSTNCSGEECWPISRAGYFGWCNRIFYRPSSLTQGQITSYERLDILRLNDSDQAAIMATITA